EKCGPYRGRQSRPPGLCPAARLHRQRRTARHQARCTGGAGRPEQDLSFPRPDARKRSRSRSAFFSFFFLFLASFFPLSFPFPSCRAHIPRFFATRLTIPCPPRPPAAIGTKLKQDGAQWTGPLPLSGHLFAELFC